MISYSTLRCLHSANMPTHRKSSLLFYTRVAEEGLRMTIRHSSTSNDSSHLTQASGYEHDQCSRTRVFQRVLSLCLGLDAKVSFVLNRTFSKN